MKTALVIPCYNRPEYLAQCFQSLEALMVKPDITLIIDDCSTDINAIALIDKYTSSAWGIVSIRNPTNLGVRGSLLRGIDWIMEQEEIYYIINLDSDAIVKPNFITELRYLHFNVGAHEQIVSGFNCYSEANKPICEGGGWILKSLCNGINMCFNKKQYSAYIRPSLLEEGNWDYNTSIRFKKDRGAFLISKPSVVQHIGLVSSMGHTNNGVKPDTACDF